MLRWLRKRLAIRSYRRRLGPKLVERYGPARDYSVDQVRTTAEKLGLDMDYICYAYAGFCEPDAFAEHHAAIGESCDWATMHDTVFGHHGAGEHHGADTHFVETHHHDYGGHQDGGFDGGGHHGGHD